MTGYSRRVLRTAAAVAALLLAGLAPARAADPATAGPLRVAVARLIHGHAGDVFESRKRGEITIVGIYEPDRELARYYEKQYAAEDVPVFSTLAELLDKTSPEVVTGYGSTAEHLELVEACAPRGVHVMVEKPLAFEASVADSIAALASQFHIQVITNYATTWFGSFNAAHELVCDKALVGDIRKVVIHDGHSGPKEIGCGPEFLAWLTDPLLNGGGALTDFGCYGASLSTWLMDGALPTSVTAVTQQIKPEVYPKVDDEATLVLTYPQAQAIIQASWNWPFDRKDMYVYGRTGYVFAPDSRTLLVRTAENKSEQPPRSVPHRAAPYDNAFNYLTAVVRGKIIPDRTDLSGLEANVSVARILEAARTSAREGRTVRLQ
ncbi:Gfo/Idh/MocA family oxidoreductase [bacterium]|nr:Gfo/Idh/MocA family oxidoreductase [bacterium]